MALFKCKMCGGSLEIAAGTTVIECEYCGTQQTLPKLDDEKRANMYDRANHFRRNNEFDKAMGIYEQILNEDNTDAEAYWSLVLCRYGIEYVEDPSTKRRIPTVNRAQYTSILADEDYKSALANADTYQKSIYELEAKAIDEIQKGILAISQKEEPFDVFICYKETDSSGKRTQDSVLAQDLYFGLKNEGFKVFFARITLEDKLGSAYEPYIFAALNSAKVMVVLGTKPEFFNAVWVKNEWSRYLALIKQGQKKMLIPAYKDMDPYNLPEEFSHLQAQDMSKLGFMQDLIRGIKKIVKADEPKATVVKETVVKETVSAGAANTAALLKRALLFLEDGDFDSADEYAEKILDIDPECSDAYIVKLLIDLKLRSASQISSYATPIDRNPNYIKALRFAKGDTRNTIEGYNQTIVERIELDNKKQQYTTACTLMNARNYDEAIATFSKIKDFKDSAKKIETCKTNKETDRKEGIYVEALRAVASNAADDKAIKKSISALQSIKGYKDADAQVEKLQVRLEKWYEDKKIADEKARIKAEQDRLEAARLAELRKIKAEQNKKKAKKIAKIAIPCLVALIILVVLTITLFIPMLRFNKADKLFAEGKYDEANSIYHELDGFSNSDQRIAVVKSITRINVNNFNEAIQVLLSAGVPVELTYKAEGGSLTETQTLMANSTLSLDDSMVSLNAEVPATTLADENNVFTFNTSADFTGLKTPGRNGYRFVAWVLDAYSYDVDNKDAKFYLSLKATWSTKDYTISYDLAGGEVDGTNKVEFDPEDESFTLINPTRTGYTFMGWTGTGLSEPTVDITIAKGSYGNKEYTATWKANEYTI
ncbi:MAG: TIR domain-containing protein, partial [Clostridia bacterium]|nr:TIR domain-containing protein [Clostridia bacterium]